MTKPDFYKKVEWSAPSHVLAYTTFRSGGMSEGPYASLNVGNHVGDKLAHVDHNRSLLPFSQQIHWLNQTHSNHVIELPAKEHNADATFTSQAGVMCAVMTADCVPVLLTDTKGEIVAAVHAGMKGLKDQIIVNTVDKAFNNVSRNQIIAWVGPHIGVCHYEISEKEALPFSNIASASSPSVNPGKVMLNLGVIAQYQLNRLGIETVFDEDQCTYCEDQLFFSYRRATHQGYKNCGRMVSTIMLLEKSST
ncbi:peptidoglycan editing factor PgeF [Alteromonas facilis]|uniref:peptidoglycan editing factor PgeF n=1 Tax=Alteromonas facilis TaxID=2048004 RepID=UPI000C28F66F|nr:peptidoglycan editing factor PgeF [Alteromonas facilis]